MMDNISYLLYDSSKPLKPYAQPKTVPFLA